MIKQALAMTGAAAVLAGGVTATGTSAASASTLGHTVTAIAYAAKHHNPYLGQVPATDIRVGRVRISGSYASVVVTPKDGRTDPAQVLERHDSRGWHVVTMGTDGVGCSLSAATRRSLLLWGPCS
ncbi:hypothetical protein [Calidifontibacter terrae]